MSNLRDISHFGSCSQLGEVRRKKKKESFAPPSPFAQYLNHLSVVATEEEGHETFSEVAASEEAAADKTVKRRRRRRGKKPFLGLGQWAVFYVGRGMPFLILISPLLFSAVAVAILLFPLLPFVASRKGKGERERGAHPSPPSSLPNDLLPPPLAHSRYPYLYVWSTATKETPPPKERRKEKEEKSKKGEQCLLLLLLFQPCFLSSRSLSLLVVYLKSSLPGKRIKKENIKETAITLIKSGYYAVPRLSLPSFFFPLSRFSPPLSGCHLAISQSRIKHEKRTEKR